MRHSGGGKPPPYGVEPIGTPGIDGLYRRRDTQVPPYAPCRQPVRVRRAAPMCAAAGRGFRLRSNADNSGTRYRAKWPPPSTPQGWRRGPWPAAGGCAICGWRFGRQGVSRRARRGCFAGCGQRVFRPLRRAGISRLARRDQRLCLWKPRFFEKNRVKLLIFFLF